MNARLDPNLAMVNITWAGQNGELPDPVARDSSDAQIRAWAAEALRGGDVPGIRRDTGADLRDFVVDRFPSSRDTPWARIFIRPKTPFGRA